MVKQIFLKFFISAHLFLMRLHSWGVHLATLLQFSFPSTCMIQFEATLLFLQQARPLSGSILIFFFPDSKTTFKCLWRKWHAVSENYPSEEACGLVAAWSTWSRERLVGLLHVRVGPILTQMWANHSCQDKYWDCFRFLPKDWFILLRHGNGVGYFG